MPRLVLRGGAAGDRAIEVERDLVIGRRDADVAIDDEEISGRHAVVRPRGGLLEIEDLGSSNGTWVNGSRIGRATVLSNGDIVELGRTSLEVVVEPAAEAHAAAPAGPPDAAFTATPARARGGIASRRITPAVFSVAAVVATAVALFFYFAER